MKNDTLKVLQNLPQGENTYLSIPKIGDMDEFLSSVKDSLEFHYPWVEAPSDKEKYQQYIQKINFESQTLNHILIFLFGR